MCAPAGPSLLRCWDGCDSAVLYPGITYAAGSNYVMMASRARGSVRTPRCTARPVRWSTPNRPPLADTVCPRWRRRFSHHGKMQCYTIAWLVRHASPPFRGQGGDATEQHPHARHVSFRPPAQRHQRVRTVWLPPSPSQPNPLPNHHSPRSTPVASSLRAAHALMPGMEPILPKSAAKSRTAQSPGPARAAPSTPPHCRAGSEAPPPTHPRHHTGA